MQKAMTGASGTTSCSRLNVRAVCEAARTHKHVMAKDITLPDHAQIVRAQHPYPLHVEHRVFDSLQGRLVALLEEDEEV